MKIAYLSSVHQPDDIRIYHKQVRTLAGAGFDVTLICKAIDRTVQLDVPHVFIKVPKGRLARFIIGGAKASLAAWRSKAQIIHFHDPELIPFALLLRLFGRKIIYDVHEDVQKDILDKHYIPKILRRTVGFGVRAIEVLGAKCFNYVVAATPAISARFPSKKTLLLQNFPFLNELKPENGAEREIGRFIYAGGISRERSFPGLMAAFSLISDSHNLKFVIAGPFSSPAIQQECERHSYWSSVEYRGNLSRSDMANELRRSQVGVVIFQPVANNVESQPNKLFEYMSAGLPVIASNFPLWRDIVLTANCGLVVDPCDPQDIARALAWFITNPIEAEQMGRRGRAAVDRVYNWEAESRKLIALYQTIQ